MVSRSPLILYEVYLKTLRYNLSILTHWILRLLSELGQIQLKIIVLYCRITYTRVLTITLNTVANLLARRVKYARNAKHILSIFDEMT